MNSNRSSRRRFLKQTAALAGVATGAGLAVRGQSAQAQHLHGELPRRGARYTIDHMTHYTPLQDYAGIITPAPLQFNHGMTSCSEWTGVLLSVLLKEAGLQKEASWLVSEGGDAGKFTHTLPLAKAMEDVIVAFGQNGEPLRVEQGYPVRLVVPGWEAPFSVKY